MIILEKYTTEYGIYWTNLTPSKFRIDTNIAVLRAYGKLMHGYILSLILLFSDWLDECIHISDDKFSSELWIMVLHAYLSSVLSFCVYFYTTHSEINADGTFL